MNKIDRNDPTSWPYVLTANQVGQITGIGRNKRLDMLKKGEIPSGKMIRGRWFINRDALIEWLKNN